MPPTSPTTDLFAMTRQGPASIISSLGADRDYDSLLFSPSTFGGGGGGNNDDVLVLDNIDDSEGTKQSSSNHLDFHDISLCGRSKELHHLRQCYKRISKGSSEAVLITGGSGTGKSKLAGALREPVTLQGNGFFVSGKFDHIRNEPYGALVEAFTDLCDVVAQQQGEDCCARIADVLKDELTVLRKVIPNLCTITGPATPPDLAKQAVVQSNGRECFTRLKLSCRKFLNAIASKKHPVVLHLDDLQWADKASIEVLQSLVTDKESKYILIIGTQRNDLDVPTVVAKDIPCNEILQPSGRKSDCLPCLNIQLDSFNLDQVTELVSTMLKMLPPQTALLAELILKRTDGLPFFVVKFMEMLKDQELLTFDHGNQLWQWSVAEIQTTTNASDNVVNVVAARIQKLKKKCHSILRLASIQGFRFDPNVLAAVLLVATKDSTTKDNDSSSSSMKKKKKRKKEGKPERTPNERVQRALKVAAKKGLVELNQDGSFKFCHDRIHGCLYFAIPNDERADLHLAVGRVMQAMLDYDDGERYIFPIADHLNQASHLLVTKEDKLDCGRCNLRATNLASAKSAYSLAAEYACRGLDQLDTTTKWSDYYYKVSLDLHSKAADSYYSCGDIDSCNRHLEEVFQNARVVSDAASAYKIKVRCLGAQAKLNEAIEVAFTVARELGVKIPKKMNMRNAIWQLIKTKSMLRGKTDEQLLAPPETESPDMRQAIGLLGMATNYASMAMKIPHLILSIVTMLQMSMRGQASDSSIFASYGILSAAMRDMPEAIRMGLLALDYEGKEAGGAHVAIGISHTFLLHWRVSFHDSLDAVMRAHHMSMDAGDFDAAFLASETYILMAFYCGHQLGDLEEQMRSHCAQMVEFDNMSNLYLSLPYWQLFLNLLGQSDVPTILTGEAMDQTVLIQESQMVNVVLQTICVWRIYLCYHFEDALSLTSLLSEYESYDTPNVGHFMYYLSRFYVGLSYISLYRKLGKRLHRQKALKIIKQMQKWTKDGCPNTKPLLSLLEAEIATLASRQTAGVQTAVKAAFDRAIVDGNEFQNASLAALANERAAFYLECLGRRESLEYMKRAVDLYDYWGAMGKVTYLEEKRDGLTGILSEHRSLPFEIGNVVDTDRDARTL